MFALRNAKSCMGETTAKLLYYTLIYPHVSNGLYLWKSTCKNYLNNLYILQKKAVQCIVNAGMLEHTLPLFQKLQILPLEYMNGFCVGQLMYYRQVNYVAPVAILP